MQGDGRPDRLCQRRGTRSSCGLKTRRGRRRAQTNRGRCTTAVLFFRSSKRVMDDGEIHGQRLPRRKFKGQRLPRRKFKGINPRSPRNLCAIWTTEPTLSRTPLLRNDARNCNDDGQHKRPSYGRPHVGAAFGPTARACPGSSTSTATSPRRLFPAQAAGAQARCFGLIGIDAPSRLSGLSSPVP